MKFRNIMLGLVAVGLAGSALADDDVKMKMSIAVMDGDGADQTHFKINSDDLDFDLHDMQEGESRSIIDEDGRSILITRVGDGFTFNIDGEILEVPGLMGEEGHNMVWIGDGDSPDVDFHVLRDTDVMSSHKMHKMNQTMIVSPKPIDAATQQAIKSLLESAGYDSDVNFVDSDSAHGGPIRIKRVEKVVENPQT